MFVNGNELLCSQVIHKHFYLKRAEIMTQCEDWIADIQQYSSDKRVGRTMSHHAAALKVISFGQWSTAVWITEWGGFEWNPATIWSNTRFVELWSYVSDQSSNTRCFMSLLSQKTKQELGFTLIRSWWRSSHVGNNIPNVTIPVTDVLFNAAVDKGFKSLFYSKKSFVFTESTSF